MLPHELRDRIEWEISDVERQLHDIDRRDRLWRIELLPSQTKYFDALHRDNIRVIVFTAANQTGKSFAIAADAVSESLGFEPWSGRTRERTPYDIALLLRDYDSHARKFLNQNVYELVPKDLVDVEYTQTRAPRVIRVKNPRTGQPGKAIHIFTHDQDPARLEGATWQKVIVDEPCPRVHFVALYRGLQKTGGKISMAMTPISEPWIYDELYAQAGNLGGPKTYVYGITAFPDENIKSKGGHLDDEGVMQFRETLTEEEREARVHGRWMHLIGRVYKNFDENVHVIPDDMDLVENPYHPDSGCAHVAIVDPHERIPWAILHGYVTPDGTHVVDYEWPDEPFENLHDCSQTYDDYARILLRHNPTMVIMDPNWGRKRSVSTGWMIFEELEAVCRLPVLTDVEDELAAGHAKVREYFCYDKSRPVDATNQPKLFIKSRCRNLIRGLLNYTWDEWAPRTGYSKAPKAKPKEKYKHFPDCLRYFVMYPIFAGRNAWKPRRGGSMGTRPYSRRQSRPRSIRNPDRWHNLL